MNDACSVARAGQTPSVKACRLCQLPRRGSLWRARTLCTLARNLSAMPKAPSQRTTSPGRGKMSPQVTKRGICHGVAVTGGVHSAANSRFPRCVPHHKNAKTGSPQAARFCSGQNNFTLLWALTPTASRGTDPRRSCGRWHPPPKVCPPGR